MKKLFSSVLALAGTFTLWAYSPAVNDIRINVSLNTDGAARITEVWDVVVASGTEWYLVRNNLGDIGIFDLRVVDENGNVFVDEGGWNVDRSIVQKARKCGLHRTGSGYEICWGVESYGPHKWTVSYTMTNVVKSLSDYDMLHMQFISSKLSSPPQHASLTLEAPVPLDSDNSRIWAFGYEGSVEWQGGKVFAESGEPFVTNSSMILLLRFDKGIFNPLSSQDRDFAAVLSNAQEGAHYNDSGESDTEDFSDFLASLISMIITWFAFVKPFLRSLGIVKKKDRGALKRLFGRRTLPSNPGWDRTIPFDGNHLRTYYIASHLKGTDDGKFTIVSAIMLRMVEKGNIRMQTSMSGKKEFAFVPGASRDWMTVSEREFYNMLIQASGEDKILQEQEFKKWSVTHMSEVYNWAKGLKEDVCLSFSDPEIADSNNSYDDIRLTPLGQQKAMQALQFRQFLKDFTVINERHVPEVSLWGEYLIVAALFGMADKVASDMKRIAPDMSIGNVRLQTANLGDVVYFSNAFSRFTRNAYALHYSSLHSGGSSGRSSGGFGGFSSFGGGGGFSGGGFGGGSR